MKRIAPSSASLPPPKKPKGEPLSLMRMPKDLFHLFFDPFLRGFLLLGRINKSSNDDTKDRETVTTWFLRCFPEARGHIPPELSPEEILKMWDTYEYNLTKFNNK